MGAAIINETATTKEPPPKGLDGGEGLVFTNH